MFKAIAIIKKRANLTDSEAAKLENSANKDGQLKINSTSISKYVEFNIEADDFQAAAISAELYCSKYLADAETEDYEFSLEETE